MSKVSLSDQDQLVMSVKKTLYKSKTWEKHAVGIQDRPEMISTGQPLVDAAC